MNKNDTYFANYFSYSRLKTREVNIGGLCIGGQNPILVQSMTNTDTLHTQTTVEQIIRIIEASGELVRITAQGLDEAENLKNIKSELLKKGFNTPLAADIHFSPKAAEIAAKYVEKVRINPGNYAEKNNKSEYSTDEYLEAIQKTAIKLKPLIEVCKAHQTAIRIGVNHGSLSNRILSKYGNTAEGMVESALEFIRIFEDHQFYDLIISLKSSNVLTMVHSNRLLASKMMQNNRIYPIHLGVTEAGNGVIGRQKSIAGIATLLNDGIGDTIRVSLTETPENEISIALKLRNPIHQLADNQINNDQKIWFNPFSCHKRISKSILNIGGKNLPVVLGLATQRNSCQVQKPLKGAYSPPADLLYIGNAKPIFLSSDKQYVQEFAAWGNEHSTCFPLLNISEWIDNKLPANQLAFLEISLEDIEAKENLDYLQKISFAVLVLSAKSENPIFEWRKAFYYLHKAQIELPVILHRKFYVDQNETLLVESTRIFSALLLDGLGDGIWLQEEGNIHLETLQLFSFGILQSCRLRLTQTDYIACPSCGRTQFNIEERLAEIRKKTNHLKHLKIAIMGCIVNGLGEMADADYGYVGSGKGKVNLYKGKVLMRKNVSEKEASLALIELIQQEGDWVEK